MTPMPSLGPIGFRLVHELEGLLRGVAADHAIVPEETDRIRRWLSAAHDYRHIQPFKELARHLDKALADGVLTLEEAHDMLFVAEHLTTVNPYFDAIRSGAQQLMGMLAGVAADQRINANEAHRLQQWTEDWQHLKGIWPFDECESLVTSLLASARWGQEVELLIALSRQFPVGGEVDTVTGEVPPLLIGGICAVNPEIVFGGRGFTFTGESSRCQREELARHVVERSGLHIDNVTKKTQYLVVCDEGNPFWAFACYGRKVERACDLRRAGHQLTIVHEVDFWDAIA